MGTRIARGLVALLLVGCTGASRCSREPEPVTDARDPRLHFERWTRAEQPRFHEIQGVYTRCLSDKVFVKGFFGAALAVTLVNCEEGTCCNAMSGSFMLAEDSKALVDQLGIPLSSSTKPDAFDCGGDDSIACCGFEAGEVIAYGEMDGGQMVDPLLCKP